MPRNLVLKDGVLSNVVESFEQVEVAQLQAEVAAKQAIADQSATDLEAATTKHNENLVALEDSKSDVTRATELVGETPADEAGEPTNDEGANGVDIPVEVVAPQL